MDLRSVDDDQQVVKLEGTEKTAVMAAAATLPAGAAPPLNNHHNGNENTPPAVGEQPDQASDQAAAVAVAEYIASEDLEPLPEPEAKITGLMEELESRDWTKVCDALNDVRRLALHHSALLLPILENVMLVMVKALKNPRSALCKTAIMASTDVFQSFGQFLLFTSEETKAFDNLLLQLLLKASQDKRFVCEEAAKALDTMAKFTAPLPLLRKLQTYVHHANPKVRAKAAVTISTCISNKDMEVMKEFGLGTLLQIAAKLLNDRLPEARDAARSIITTVHGEFSKENDLKGDDDEKEEDDGSKASDSWQIFCSSNLPPISVQSIVKLVSQ